MCNNYEAYGICRYEELTTGTIQNNEDLKNDSKVDVAKYPGTRHAQQSGCSWGFTKICVVGKGVSAKRLRAPTLLNIPQDSMLAISRKFMITLNLRVSYFGSNGDKIELFIIMITCRMYFFYDYISVWCTMSHYAQLVCTLLHVTLWKHHKKCWLHQMKYTQFSERIQK